MGQDAPVQICHRAAQLGVGLDRRPIRLGLDLQGGMPLVLEIDASEVDDPDFEGSDIMFRRMMPPEFAANRAAGDYAGARGMAGWFPDNYLAFKARAGLYRGLADLQASLDRPPLEQGPAQQAALQPFGWGAVFARVEAVWRATMR